jgi:hypothetical protein
MRKIHTHLSRDFPTSTITILPQFSRFNSNPANIISCVVISYFLRFAWSSLFYPYRFSLWGTLLGSGYRDPYTGIRHRDMAHIFSRSLVRWSLSSTEPCRGGPHYRFFSGFREPFLWPVLPYMLFFTSMAPSRIITGRLPGV